PIRFLGRPYPKVDCLVFGFGLALAASILLIRAAGGRPAAADPALCVAIAAGIAALRPMLGRVDPAHVSRYGVLAVVPLTWSVRQARRSGPARFVLTGALVFGIAVAIHPLPILREHVDVVEGATRRWRSFAPLPIPRSGGARLSTFDVQNIEAFRAYVDRRLR